MSEILRGEIVQITPSAIAPGEPLNVYVTYNCLFAGVLGFWGTTLRAVLDGQSDSDTQTHFGEEGHRTSEKLMLGVMPGRAVRGYVTLKKDDQTLAVKSFTVELPEYLAPVTPLPPVKYVPTPPAAQVPDEKKWWEVWKPDPTPTTPISPVVTVPPAPPLIEAERKTWLWVGLAVAGVIGVAFFMRR